MIRALGPARMPVAVLGAVVAVVLALLGPAPAATATTTATTPPAATSMCASPTARFHCLGETLATDAAATSRDWDAQDLQQQYGVTDLSAPTASSPRVAVVESFGYPNLASDLARYRSVMGLPACTQASGCLTVVNQGGQSSPLPATAPRDDDWTGETALDLDVVSAVCPSCRLLVVEAGTDMGIGMFVGDRTAARLTSWVSDSWTVTGNSADDNVVDADYLDNGDTILTAATGDDGYTGKASYPATSPYAIAVGGVSQEPGGTTATAWNKAGSSCASFVTKPEVQQGVTSGCTGRAAADVSAIASSKYGIAIYDSMNGNGGWIDAGGTSAAAPLIAALYATVGNHTDPWAPYVNAARDPSLFTDITSGRNGTCGTALCDAGVGWDGPTGIGMPRSPQALAVSSAEAAQPGFQAVAEHGLSGHYGSPATLTITVPTTVTDDSGATETLRSAVPDTLDQSGTPAGMRFSLSGGALTLTGTPQQIGSGIAHVSLDGTRSDGTVARGELAVPWTIRASTLATAAHPRLAGRLAPGRVVHVVVPKIHAGSATGRVVHPHWTITWMVRGHEVTSKRFHIPRSAGGALLRVRVTATLAGYAGRGWSTKVHVRR